MGFYTLILLAGLQAIPADLYEASAIDGAGAWRTFRSITLPWLRPMHVIVVALGVIEAVKVFDLIYSMTNGGPAWSTQTLATWMYFNMFQYFNIGYGSALAWVMSRSTSVSSVSSATRSSSSRVVNPARSAAGGAARSDINPRASGSSPGASRTPRPGSGR